MCWLGEEPSPLFSNLAESLRRQQVDLAEHEQEGLGLEPGAVARKLDGDGNNLLTFEEWAVATSDRFGAADANHDGILSPAEFATTAPKRNPKPKCGCAK